VAKTRKTAWKAKEPEVGADEWYAREQEKPGYALAEMKNLSNLIAQGSKWAIESLERWIKKYPDVARTLSKLGDLCAAAEAEWVKSLAGDDSIEQLAVKDEIAKMKAELLGEKPSILEQVLVSSILTARLSHQKAVMWAAQPAEQLAVATARDKRVESTARWLLTALKSLAVVRQQQARGLSPKVKLKVFEGRA
jgi:hypothetical protein